MRRLATPALIAAGLLLLGACADGTAEAGPTPRPISAECRESFAAATEVEERDIGREHEEGTLAEGSFRHLLPTLEACQTTEEWFEAYRGYTTAATEGVAPSSALRSLCDKADAREMDSARICDEMARMPREEHPGG
jgi:hypothetical protein